MALKDKGPIYILAPNITEILLRSAQILSEHVVVLDFLAVDNFDFTRKIGQKNIGRKTREIVGVLSKLNFWTKI